jgi:hypothetical protein
MQSIIDGDGLVSFIRCKVCSKVEGRNNLLIPKLDFLLKHSGKRKATFVILGVKVREFYKNKKCAHAKNQVLFTQILTNYILQLVINQGLAFNKRKFV